MSRPHESGGERYRFEFRLPDAGLGEVWTALDRARDDAPVLVKLLGAGAPGGAADPHALPALAERLARAAHPDVLPVLAWGEHEGRAYLVHERFEGRSLASWLAGHRKARTRPGLATSQRLFDRVAGALQGVRERAGADAPPHGALSPRSVLVRRESPGHHDTKVIDFGAAWLLVPASGGHPAPAAYLSPEQLGDPTHESARSDVFALAALLAEVLSPAFAPAPDGPGQWAALALEGGAKVRAKLASLRSDVPHAVWDLVALAFQADPALRPEHAGELRALLQQQWRKVGLWEKAALTPEPDPPDAPLPALPDVENARTRFGAAPSPNPPPAAPSIPPMGSIPLPPPPVVAPQPVVAPPPAPPEPTPWRAPPPRASVTAWDHADEPPLTLPVAPPSLAPAPLQGLGAAPRGASPRPPTLAPAPLPFAPTPLPPAVDAPTMVPHVPSPALRDLLGEHTSLDVFAPLDAAPEETTGEEAAPFDDPSPTPPDGLPSAFATDDVTDYRPYPSARPTPPDAAPPPAPPPKRSRLRARTIGVDEAEQLELLAAPIAAPPARPTPEPEGTRMIQLGPSGAAPDAATLLAAPPPAPRAPSGVWSGVVPTPLAAPPTPDPFGGAPAPVVERTMAIDLSAPGVAAPYGSSPGLAPHAWAPPPASPPPAPVLAPPPAAARPVGWIIAGAVGVFALAALLLVLARS